MEEGASYSTPTHPTADKLQIASGAEGTRTDYQDLSYERTECQEGKNHLDAKMQLSFAFAQKVFHRGQTRATVTVDTG